MKKTLILTAAATVVLAAFARTYPTVSPERLAELQREREAKKAAYAARNAKFGKVHDEKAAEELKRRLEEKKAADEEAKFPADFQVDYVLKRECKSRMKNRLSYQPIETKKMKHPRGRMYVHTYSGTNSFGARVEETVALLWDVNEKGWTFYAASALDRALAECVEK